MGKDGSSAAPVPTQPHWWLYSPDVQAGQHGRGAPTKNPHGEEDDEQRGAEHHLPGIGGRVTDGKGKCHGSSQPCERKGQWSSYLGQGSTSAVGFPTWYQHPTSQTPLFHPVSPTEPCPARPGEVAQVGKRCAKCLDARMRQRTSKHHHMLQIRSNLISPPQIQ